MALYSRNVEKRRSLHDFRRHEEEVVGSLCRLSNRPVSPKSQMEQEKRIRREIANSNERRRMQSINAGFQSLRTLLPHHDGEKLSKAAILQQTAEYIYQLEQEKTRLLTQNCQLKRLLNQQNHDSDGGSSVDSPLPKRKKIELPVAETVDEGIGSMSPPGGEDHNHDDVKKEMIELRVQLDRERKLRMMFEEQTRGLEAQLYPERVKEITNQVHIRYKSQSPEHSELYTESLEHEEIHEPLVIVKENTAPEEQRVPESIEVSTVISESKSPEKTEANVADSQLPRIYAASTSRQNLETIVEAIRHLEGDHLFQDDPMPNSTALPTVESGVTTIPTATTRVIREVKSEDVQTYNSTQRATSPRTKVSALCQEVPYRQQVIQVPPIVRPGVIVSTHS